MTQKECVLTALLDCGYCDLEMLEDIQYDLDDIVKKLVGCGKLSMNSIICAVFSLGIKDLKDYLDLHKEEIKERICEQISAKINDTLQSGNSLTDYIVDGNVGLEEQAYALLTSDELDPMRDAKFFLNCMDSHISIKHLDFYRTFIPEVIDYIEEQMGWDFKDLP